LKSAQDTCDAINAVAEFMVDVAGVDFNPRIRVIQCFAYASLGRVRGRVRVRIRLGLGLGSHTHPVATLKAVQAIPMNSP
jgi:hypothetical protein